MPQIKEELQLKPLDDARKPYEGVSLFSLNLKEKNNTDYALYMNTPNSIPKKIATKEDAEEIAKDAVKKYSPQFAFTDGKIFTLPDKIVSKGNGLDVTHGQIEYTFPEKYKNYLEEAINKRGNKVPSISKISIFNNNKNIDLLSCKEREVWNDFLLDQIEYEIIDGENLEKIELKLSITTDSGTILNSYIKEPTFNKKEIIKLETAKRIVGAPHDSVLISLSLFYRNENGDLEKINIEKSIKFKSPIFYGKLDEFTEIKGEPFKKSHNNLMSIDSNGKCQTCWICFYEDDVPKKFSIFDNDTGFIIPLSSNTITVPYKYNGRTMNYVCYRTASKIYSPLLIRLNTGGDFND